MSAPRQIRNFVMCLIPAIAVLATLRAWAAEEAAWTLSKDGAVVTDPLRKLSWSRCVEGLQWKGHACVGEALMLTHGAAVALAVERSRVDGTQCRLPSVAELQMQAKNIEAAWHKNLVLFPEVSHSWRWAGNRIVNTASVNQYNYGNIMQGRTNDNAVRLDTLHAWAVNQETGEARKDVTKRTRLPVQLVCPVL